MKFILDELQSCAANNTTCCNRWYTVTSDTHIAANVTLALFPVSLGMRRGAVTLSTTSVATMIWVWHFRPPSLWFLLELLGAGAWPDLSHMTQKGLPL